MKHKWAKEIKAFVDGKRVEYRLKMHYIPYEDAEEFEIEWSPWSQVFNLLAFNNDDSYQFRVNNKKIK
jgi:hypothetical protein